MKATERLRAFRQEKRLTLADLANRLGGVSIGHISDIETGKRPTCSVDLALRVERLTKGVVLADELSPEVRAVRDQPPPRRRASLTAKPLSTLVGE